MNLRLLIIEDQKDLADLMKERLMSFGYACDVAYDGIDGEFKGTITEYDAILLDLNMPNKDGFEILADWRTNGMTTPVLIVSARVDIAQRVKGLELGSDDYIVKPFEFEELHARIQAVIRRFHGRVNPIIEIGILRVNPKTRKVSIADKEIKVSAKEFDIIEFLAMNHPNVISVETLADHIYNEGYDPFSSVIRVHIASVRNKLQYHGHSLIINIKGKGYYICES